MCRCVSGREREEVRVCKSFVCFFVMCFSVNSFLSFLLFWFLFPFLSFLSPLLLPSLPISPSPPSPIHRKYDPSSQVDRSDTSIFPDGYITAIMARTAAYSRGNGAQERDRDGKNRGGRAPFLPVRRPKFLNFRYEELNYSSFQVLCTHFKFVYLIILLHFISFFPFCFVFEAVYFFYSVSLFYYNPMRIY
jgi:hypothetical protein